MLDVQKGCMTAATLWVALGCGGDSGLDQAGAMAGAMAGAGGAASGPAGGAGLAPVSFATTIQPKLDEACNCHQTSPNLIAPFSLKVGEAYATLVGTPSLQVPTMQRVKPGSLNESYLWHKINGTQGAVGGSGLIMPSTIPLRPDELVLFERWIASGAQP